MPHCIRPRFDKCVTGSLVPRGEGRGLLKRMLKRVRLAQREYRHDTKIPRYTSPTPTTSVPGLPHPTPRGRDIWDTRDNRLARLKVPPSRGPFSEAVADHYLGEPGTIL